MAIPRTSLLDLPLPVTGSLSGDWGAATNNGLTEYLDIAVAGSLVLNTDADVTLTSTDGDENGTNIGSTTAQYAILRWTATGSTTRNITVPAKSKTYIVINATGGTQSIVLRGAGPTTGVTIVSGEKAVCAWNGSDFVKVGGAAGGSNTQVQYNNAGVFGGITNATTDGTTLSMTSPKVITGINDTNGAELLKVTATASAVNELTLANAAAGNAPTLSATGDDTNIGITLTPKGTGTLFTAGNVSFDGGTFVFNESGADKDFRIEGDTDANLFFTDASTDRVGIGTSSPQSLLNTASTGQVQIGTSSWPTSMIGKSNARTIIGNEGVLILWNEAAATAGNEATLYIGPKGSGTNGSTIIAGGFVKGVSESSSTNNGALTFGTNSGGGNSEKMRLDSSGNLGLGVTPSAWNSGYKAFVAGGTNSNNQVGGIASGSGITVVSTNYYRSATPSDLYAGDGFAMQYRQVSGQHQWYTAPSGTAGATTSITSGQVYTVTTLGSTTLGQWQAYFSGLSSIPSIGQSITATATGTLAGGATVTQTITFTQAMTLDASGYLLVGATSTAGVGASRLQVGSTSQATSQMLVQGASTHLGIYAAGAAEAYVSYAVGSALIFGNGPADGSTFTERARINSSGTFFIGNGETAASPSAGILSATGGDTSANNIAGANLTIRGGASTGTGAGGVIIFSTAAASGTSGTATNSATERARITSGGYFKASNNGTYYSSSGSYHEFNQNATNDQALIVYANTTSYTGACLDVWVNRNTTNNTFTAIRYYNPAAGASRFLVADSGNVTNTNGTYGTISDAKMKTDIVDAGSQWADIKAIRFRKFKMKDDPSGLLQLGVVAQELEQTSPGLVEEHADRDAEGNDLGTTTKSVKTSILLMKAAKALQEAMARIETLEAKVAALEGTQP